MSLCGWHGSTVGHVPMRYAAGVVQWSMRLGAQWSPQRQQGHMCDEGRGRGRR